MRDGYVRIAIIWILSYSTVYAVVHAEEPPSGQAGTSGGHENKTDPFGGGDPFAVINGTQASPQSDTEASPQVARRPDMQAAVFFKEFLVGINDASRVNPQNRITQLKDNYGALETRMTLSDHLDQRRTWRWLFKGFASTSSYRENDNALRDLARIDELFTDWKDQGWFASVGKRRVNWGHAQGFNPINVVAPPRDPLNPGYETEGRPMAWFSRAGRVTTDLIITRNYDKNWSSDQNRWGLKWSTSGAQSDYAVYYFDGAHYSDGRAFDRMYGASFSANAMPGLTLYAEAADFSRNYRNYYEAGGATKRKEGSYFQGVVGSTVDLGGKSSMFVEYFYNGQGYTGAERESYLLTADARLAAVSDTAVTNDFVQLSMNRGYLLVGYTKEYREKYTFNLSVLVAEDNSSSTRVEGAYALSDYYEFRASYLHNAGDGNSEFGNSPYAGLVEIGFNASF